MPSWLVPTNLREIKMLVTLLHEMPDRIDKEKRLDNQDVFKTYFLTQWIHCLLPEDRNIAFSMQDETDYTKLNKTTVWLLTKYAQNLLKMDVRDRDDEVRISPYQLRISEITNPNNYSENISLGDVMAIVANISSMAASSQSDALVFFVRSYYSMLLYELYDHMTELSDTKKLDNINDTGSKDFPELKNNVEYNIPDYFKLVANSFFTLTGNSFMPRSSQKNFSREITMINGALLYDMIREITKDYMKDAKVTDTPEFQMKLKIVEFFVLCTSRKVETKNAGFSVETNSRWRAETMDFYFSPFGAGTRNLLFEATAPFVNLIYPKYAYDRFDTRLFGIVKACKESIYNRIISNPRNDDYTPEHDLMSRMCVRNIEVLNDLSLWLSNRRNLLRPGSNGDIDVLIQFYRQFDENRGGYSVKTYDRKENNNEKGDNRKEGKKDYHIISFTPLSYLGKFLVELITIDENREDAQWRRKLLEKFKNIYYRYNRISGEVYYTQQEIITILRDTQVGSISEKDNIISQIMQGHDDIQGSVLANYLADPNVYELVIFSDFFEPGLYEVYKNNIIKRLAIESDTLNSQYKNLQSIDSDLMEQLNTSKAKIRSCSSKISSLNKKLTKDEEKLAKLRADLDAARQSYEKYEQSKKEIPDQIKPIKDKLNSIISDIKTGEQKLEDIEKELKGLEDLYYKADSIEDKQDIESKMNALATENVSLSAEVKDLQKQRSDLESSIKGLESELNNAIKDSAKYQKIIPDLETEMDSLDSTIWTTRTLIDEQESDKDEIQHDKKMVEENLKNVNSKIKNVQKDIASYEKRLEKIVSQLK